MASRKQEIRKELKKKEAKEIEALGLNPDAEIVDLSDDLGEDIVVETFEDSVKKPAQKIEFNTTPQVQKRGFFASVKYAFSQDNKILKTLDKQADQVLAKEPEYLAMSDEELAHQTDIFREKIKNGASLDDILIDAYATVREAAYRVLGLKAFKVQIMGAISLHNGDIAEMKTGEGKTLTSIFPVYLNAIEGKGVHVVTVNDYLAGRDKTENGKVLEFLGLTVGLNMRELTKEQKRAQHNCDVTYTTNAELGFDYLRDNMVTNLEDKVLRPLNYALVDEVDSILVDESRTPLIISGGKKNTAALYVQADKFVKSLIAEKDYEVDIESKTVSLTANGITKAEKGFKIDNLYDPEHTALVHHINQALKANYTMQRDVEYMIATEDGSHDIRNASIMIIDQFTGRVMPGRAYSDGLHQAIEAKEGVPIKEETVTLATITYQNFFRLFNKLAGMTGTAKTEEEEFRTIYNMRVIEIPTNRPVIRDDKADLVYSTQKAKYKAICDEVERRHSYGQPILLGTVSVETSEVLSRMLNKRGIRHNVLNAKNHAKEALIIEKAGVMGAVTIATNMAGRGTDIKLGEGVYELGGLMVIGSERHESRRIDNQLRGRSGRQGDPGCSQFYVSFEDELMQRFAPEKLQQFSGYLEDEAIESKMVTKSIESAQKRVEGQNFDIRKQLLQYDDIMRQQREIMYKERDDIMSQEDLSEIVKGMFEQAVEATVHSFTKNDGKNNLVDVEGAMKYVSKNYMLLSTLHGKNIDCIENEPQKLVKSLSEIVYMQYQNRFNKDLPAELKLDYERRVLLGIIDHTWINHIDAMQKLRNGIYLRAYAQKDPLQEYTEEAFYMFEEMTKSISQDISRNIVHMGIAPGSEIEQQIPAIQIEVEFKKSIMELYELKNGLEKARLLLQELFVSTDIEGLKREIEGLTIQTMDEHFWDDQDHAKKIYDQLNEMKKIVDSYDHLSSSLDELDETFVLVKEHDDADFKEVLDQDYEVFEKELEDFEKTLLFSGDYDHHNAILEIHPGAGGTESQDWAAMLMRMYQRYGDKKGFKVEVLDYLDGEEAGLKSVTMRFVGYNAYGHLKAEKGVHRLVRISPFDSSKRRHTSFASVDVMPEFDNDIEIEINQNDLRIDTYRASGAGGQHINKTDSAIRITHLPTNIVVTCQSQRSQIQNREQAMIMLKSKLYQVMLEEQASKLSDIKGEQKAIEWGSQIRSYVLHPYSLVKDNRSGYESNNPKAILDGDIDDCVYAYLKSIVKENEDA